MRQRYAARPATNSGELGIAAQGRDVVDEDRATLERRFATAAFEVSIETGGLHRDGREPARLVQFLQPRRRRRSPRVYSRRLCPRSRSLAIHPLARLDCDRRVEMDKPPSENESGVTLTTPITDGRGKALLDRITPETKAAGGGADIPPAMIDDRLSPRTGNGESAARTGAEPAARLVARRPAAEHGRRGELSSRRCCD